MASVRTRSPGTHQLRAYNGIIDGVRDYKYRTFHGTKPEAVVAAREFQSEVDGHRSPTQTAGTIGAIFEEYVDKHKWKTKTSKQLARDDMDRYLLPAFGAIKTSKFDEKPIEKFYEDLQAEGDECKSASGKALGDNSIRRLHTTGRAALNWGVKHKKIGWNPFLMVEVAAEEDSDVRAPDPEEILDMCAAATGAFGVFVRTAVSTGRRRQDILALRLNDLKPHEPALVFDERVTLQRNGNTLTPNQRKILTVLADAMPTGVASPHSGRAAHELMRLTGQPTVVAVSKALRILERKGLIERTQKGRRTYRIAITDAGLNALETEASAASSIVIERFDKNKRTARVGIDQETMDMILAQVDLLERRAAAAHVKLARNAFIFTDDLEGKEPWRPDSTSRKFAQLMGQLRFDYTLHSLRHFHITELLTGGVFGDPMDVETVATRVGDTPATIYKVYSHLRRTSDDRAAKHMGRFFAESAKPKLRAV